MVYPTVDANSEIFNAFPNYKISVYFVGLNEKVMMPKTRYADMRNMYLIAYLIFNGFIKYFIRFKY